MKNFRLLVFLVIAGSLGQARTKEPDSPYTEWPCGKDYERIGNPDFGAIFTIYAPSSFVENPPAMLIGKPWGAVHFEWWRPDGSTTDLYHWDIGMINGHQKGYFVILMEWDRWIRLNEPKGWPRINQIMQHSYPSLTGEKPIPVQSMSSQMLGNYISSVAQLSSDIGGRIYLMDADYWKDTFFSKEDSRKMRPLCGPPVISKEKDAVKVSANMLISTGAVLRWTLTLLPDDSLTITKIEAKELAPAGSLSYPIEDL